jgi:flagellar hook assembly protein FlgD
LRGNVPNPFNPMTRIRYELPETGAVTLEVFDLTGRLVRVLRNGVKEGPGLQSVSWDGTDGAGRSVASGVYLYRLNMGSHSESRRMVLVR